VNLDEAVFVVIVPTVEACRNDPSRRCPAKSRSYASPDATKSTGTASLKLTLTDSLIRPSCRVTNAKTADSHPAVRGFVGSGDQVRCHARSHAGGRDLSTSHRLTLDYEENYRLISSVFEALYRPGFPPFSIEEVVDHLDAHPDLQFHM